MMSHITRSRTLNGINTGPSFNAKGIGFCVTLTSDLAVLQQRAENLSLFMEIFP